MDYIALGQRIKKIRQAKGFTQRTAAMLIGISVPFYGLIERGQRKASLETVVAICNVFHVSMDDVLADSLRIRQENGDVDYTLLANGDRKILYDAIKMLSKYLPSEA